MHIRLFHAFAFISWRIETIFLIGVIPEQFSGELHYADNVEFRCTLLTMLIFSYLAVNSPLMIYSGIFMQKYLLVFLVCLSLNSIVLLYIPGWFMHLCIFREN